MKTRALFATLGLALAGCTVGPDVAPPTMDVPSSFSQAAATQATTRPTTQPVDLARWWESFGDPTLNSLVAQSLEANHDLRIAASRVREARAQRGIVGSTQWPTVNAGGGYTRSRASDNAGSPFSLGEQDTFQAGFDADWEIDVFGGNRRSIEAADADVEAATETYRDVLVSLLGEVARSYIELRAFQQQLDITQQNIRAQRETLELTQSRFNAGLTGELDVKRAAAQVSVSEAFVPPLETSIQQTIHQISILTGKPPLALHDELSVARPIPPMPPAVPLGLPSDLLLRRPDLRQATRQIEAATARIGVATADLYPRFFLTGGAGLQGADTADLGAWDSRFWSIGPSVSWPIFSGGRIRASIRVQEARQEQALLRYEQAVLRALADVEDALTAYAKGQLRRQSLADAVASNRRAVELSRELYTRGLVDFLSVLESERSLFTAEEQIAQSDRTVGVSLVSLYKALGGGW
jgi:NodT family efflux transporter outer membrane factor (OMF) lipoprotein